MRRASFTPAFKLSVDEPLIVVDETEENDNTISNKSSSDNEDDKDSPDNPYLLSPWRDPRDTRKHSLPNIQCTEGIKASQVRRLSDGGDNIPNAQEAAFLAQLSQASTSSGRRHSIVTISRVPPILFGRNRRESFAAFASGECSEIASNFAKHRGSVHNLQLDIMDGIVQVGKV